MLSFQKQNFPHSKTVIENDGQVFYQESWLPVLLATHYLESFTATLAWEQEQIAIFGKKIPCPRLTTWCADHGVTYKYSGILHEGKGWHPELFAIKEMLEQQTGMTFNSVLCNYYRDGQDSMGWHSDDEPELGNCPNIASVSLGASRRFFFKHKFTKQTVVIELAHGSLLLMLGETQHHWRHAIPKTRSLIRQRINLTFRFIG